VLTAGLTEWGGPARCTDQLAAAMDFGSVDELGQESARLVQALRASAPLSARDWTRVLVATEFVFASDVFGSGVDWSATTGLGDEETVRLLRGLQRKLRRAGAVEPPPHRPARGA